MFVGLKRVGEGTGGRKKEREQIKKERKEGQGGWMEGRRKGGGEGEKEGSELHSRVADSVILSF